MDIIAFLPEFLRNTWYFLAWRDALEIIFFSTLFYYSSLWLKKDKQKNLLLSLYGYCFVLLSAHFLQLKTMSSILLVFAPVAAMLFILFHQQQLQRNFIMLKNILPLTKELSNDWLGIVFRSCLNALNKQQEVIYIIEQEDNLQELLEAPIYLNTTIQLDLLTMFIEAPSFETNKFIWINTQGQLVAINAMAKKNENLIISSEVKELPQWQQQALYITTHTDALVFATNSSLHTFIIIAQGKCIEQLNANDAIKIIRRYTISTKDQKSKGEVLYDTGTQKSSITQLQS